MGSYLFYVGYQKNGGGIAECAFDERKKALTVGKTICQNIVPSYLTINSKGNLAAAAVGTMSGASIYLFSRKEELPFFVEIICQTMGNGFSHICFGPDDHFLFTTDYQAGTIQCYEVNYVEKRMGLFQEIHQYGSGPNQERQGTSHPHSVFPSAFHGYIAVSDLGADTLSIYQKKSGASMELVSQWKSPPGSGPRHVAFTRQGRRGYLLTELSSEIIFFVLDEWGSIHVRQRVSALKSDFSGENLASEIHLSLDERFLYVSNRGANQIAKFTIAPDGSLADPCYISTRGWPREFCFTEDGKYMLVLNEEFADSKGEIEVFSVNQENGALNQLGIWMALPGAYTMIYAGMKG